jgi:hypothetical protein
MDLTRRRILFCAPAIILTPGLLMPVRARDSIITVEIRAVPAGEPAWPSGFEAMLAYYVRRATAELKADMESALLHRDHLPPKAHLRFADDVDHLRPQQLAAVVGQHRKA